MSLPNPLLRRIPRDELPADLQPAWENAYKVTGDATFIEVSGNAPDSLRWYLQSFYQDRFYNSALPRRVLELVRLRLANLHGCAFCNKGDRAQAPGGGHPPCWSGALILAAVLLFVFTFLINTVAELVRQRLRRRYAEM